jgi:hypothetical protein
MWDVTSAAQPQHYLYRFYRTFAKVVFVCCTVCQTLTPQLKCWLEPQIYVFSFLYSDPIGWNPQVQWRVHWLLAHRIESRMSQEEPFCFHPKPNLYPKKNIYYRNHFAIYSLRIILECSKIFGWIPEILLHRSTAFPKYFPTAMSSINLIANKKIKNKCNQHGLSFH